MGDAIVGVNETAVSEWLFTNIGAAPPCTFELVAGGRSNLTYAVTDARGRRFALRRPPVHHVLPTAHDMVREFTVISAVAKFGIPVPAPYGLCTDEAINERSFYVMEFVDGAILRDRAQVEATYPEPQRRAIGVNLARILAGLHAVDVNAAGLTEFARHDGYIERQLRRWRAQYEQMAVPGVDHGGIVEEVGDLLATSVPEQQATTIVHGDFRLDNTVLDEAGYVKAILDWEICTLGDPLADLGLLLVYWNEHDDSLTALVGGPTTAPGMATRAEVLAAYATETELDLSRITYYQAFGYWKLACILQGVFARYQAGATAGDRGSVDEFPRHIGQLAETARRTLEQA